MCRKKYVVVNRLLGRAQMFARSDLNNGCRRKTDGVDTETGNRIGKINRGVFIGNRNITDKNVGQDQRLGEKYSNIRIHCSKVRGLPLKYNVIFSENLLVII